MFLIYYPSQQAKAEQGIFIVLNKADYIYGIVYTDS